jgi:hypothetical protein
LAVKLVDNMKNRVSDVIENKGDFILYWWSEYIVYVN